MKRVLVVDDEQHVVDHIVRIIEREAPGEFAVVGTAGSGRQALELAPSLAPEIVLLDVRMPGLSGLDTVREFQRRGSQAAFVLSTAYERFDIAREALELGITGYLLKPATREALIQGLRNAGTLLDQRNEARLRDFAQQEHDRDLRAFATDAFLSGLMLGRVPSDLQAVRRWLGLEQPWALIGAAAFVHHPRDAWATLENALHYKTKALCGPLVSDRCLVFLALAAPDEAPRAERALLEAVGGGFRIGFADPRPFEEWSWAWPEAVGRLLVRATPSPSARFSSGGSFEEDSEFHQALAQGDGDRLRFAFETLLAPFEGEAPVSVPDRYRIISLLGAAFGRLVGLGQLDEAVAHQAMDFDDLRQATLGGEFCLLARSRLPALTAALKRSQQWSPPLAAAMECIRLRYGEPLTLDFVAELVGVTPKRLSRLFIDELGQGFSDYLIDYRIGQSKILLSLPGSSIKQVSRECGYPDPNYFARLFKKVTGVTPSEFSAHP